MQGYCAALQDAGGCRHFRVPFLLLASMRNTTAQHLRGSGKCKTKVSSFLLLVSTREARTTTPQHAGMQEKLQGLANEIDRVKIAGTRTMRGHGIRVRAHAVP